MKIAVLGGTGAEGKGLAKRFAQAGMTVVIGSRQAEKAKAAAGETAAQYGVQIEGALNVDAAAVADVVVLSVPFSAHKATLQEVMSALDGKLLIDIAVPLMPGKPAVYAPPPEGSAVEQAVSILAGRCQVVGAFQTVAAHEMDSDTPLSSDVLLTGDDDEAKQRVTELIEAIGARGVDCGKAASASYVEALTPMLIGMNKRYKRRGIGIRFTGI